MSWAGIADFRRRIAIAESHIDHFDDVEDLRRTRAVHVACIENVRGAIAGRAEIAVAVAGASATGRAIPDSDSHLIGRRCGCPGNRLTDG